MHACLDRVVAQQLAIHIPAALPPDGLHAKRTDVHNLNKIKLAIAHSCICNGVQVL